MGITSGKGTRVQLGHETVWGTAVTPKVAIAHLSESMVPSYDKSEEESLVGGKVASAMDTMKVSVAGDVNTNAKPDGMGDLLYLSMGQEENDPIGDADDGYTHTLTLVPSGVSYSLPSATLHIDRHVAKRNYTGMKASSLGISGSSGERLSLSVSMAGMKELLSTDAGFQDLAVLPTPTKKSFRFADGSLSIDGDSSSYCKVTSFDFNLSNNMDEGSQTLCSGLFSTEMEPNQREVTLSLDAFYTGDFETLRTQKYIGDVTASVVLTFVSVDDIEGALAGTKYEMVITLPAVIVTDMNPVVQGAERLTLSIAATALDTTSGGTSVEPVTVTLKDDVATKYQDRV